MPPTMYFWSSNESEWGHISLQLSNGTYISHWPAKTKSKTNFSSVPARQMRNLAYDIFAERRDPDETIELRDEMLDESKISKYWDESKSTTTYHSVSNNCARVVLKCIEIGLKGKSKSVDAWDEADEKLRQDVHMIGASSCTDMAETTMALGYSNFVQVTPADILDLVKYWKKAFERERQSDQSDDRSCKIL